MGNLYSNNGETITQVNSIIPGDSIGVHYANSASKEPQVIALLRQPFFKRALSDSIRIHYANRSSKEPEVIALGSITPTILQKSLR